jgi:uncharacterized membrane protein YeaQ/YmgE (transglycosylase-associated protein family)
MNETILSLVTILVTLVLGVLAKKSTFINNKIIPLQNIFIGIIIAIIEWIITKDFKIAIATSGLIAGGMYDIAHNLKKILEEE